MAAVTLGSCSNEEIGERNILPDENGRTPIAITTYLPQTTRGYNAQEATISSLSNSGGGFTIHAVNTTDRSTVINGWTYVASGDGSSSPANTSLMAYWPDDNSKVNFYAYYPAGGASLSAFCTPDVESGTLAITTDGTKDFMAAYASASKDDNNGSVSLQFRHLMAQTVINVLANATNMPDGTTHTLTGLTLSAPGAATLTFSSGAVVANADAAATYAFHSAETDNPIELSADATTVGTAMIPASTGTGTKAQLTVDYTATISGNTRSYSRTAEVTLISGYKNQINVSVQGDMPLTIKAVVEDMPINHPYVDLGLPSGTLWATYNVGASSPEEFGNYYVWGETKAYGEEDPTNEMNYQYNSEHGEPSYVKTYYGWETYKYCNGSGTTLTKYCTSSALGYNGFTDELTTLQDSDDAATANWGSKWRIPYKSEWKELVDNCEWSWTTQNGVVGRLAIGPNHNSIFLPAAGQHVESTACDTGWRGYYLEKSNEELADCNWYPAFLIGETSSELEVSAGGSRYAGVSVRAVFVKQ